MPVLEATRRRFIRSAALAAASSVIGSRAVADPPPPPGGHALPMLPDVKWDKAPCRFCGTGCHVQVGVKDGKVVAVSGDRQAEVNKGLSMGADLYVTKPFSTRELMERINGLLDQGSASERA